MNEFERIGLEFDIALENSDSMMDMIYNVLSIEENNIYLKESSEELSDEELYNMYTDAADKFMEKVRNKVKSAAFLKALGNAKRLEIVGILRKGEKKVG